MAFMRRLSEKLQEMTHDSEIDGRTEASTNKTSEKEEKRSASVKLNGTPRSERRHKDKLDKKKSIASSQSSGLTKSDSIKSPSSRRAHKRVRKEKISWGENKDMIIARLLDVINNQNCSELESLLERYHEELERIISFDINGASLLHYAASRPSEDIIDVLLCNGFDVNKPTQRSTEMHLENYSCTSTFRRGSTPLYIASVAGYDKIVGLLARSGANINCKDMEEYTPLHNAAWNNKTELVECLISYGADLNSIDSSGSTPLRKAAYRGHTPACKLLLEAGCEINKGTKRGRTPLHSSAFNGYTEVAQLLISHGANINIQDADGVTPLHAAVYNAQRQTVKVLLRAKAQVNIETSTGNTALHMACTEKLFIIAKYLIKSGANINKKNKFGESAVSILESRLSQEQVANILTKSHYQKDYLEQLEHEAKNGSVFKERES